MTFDLAASLLRMTLAYGLSLAFSLGYGFYAATNRTGERVLIPVLDILQSVPILGFFPVVIALLVGFPAPGSFIGPNLASIFLIFTSMSWNMAFGVYESLKGVPADLREAADSFGVHGWQRARAMIVPATVNRLVYNTVLSWTNGWYFLVAAEIISSSSSTTTLPGIGSYLSYAATYHAPGELALGLGLLIVLVAALDLFAWRPLGRWAEKYRYDQAPGGAAVEIRATAHPVRRAAGYIARGFVSGVSRIRAPIVTFVSRVPFPRPAPASPRARTFVRTLVVGVVLVLVWLLLIALAVAVVRTVAGPIAPLIRQQINAVPVGILFSGLRVLLAYLISVAIALPLAIYLVRHPRAYRGGLPAVEIVASIPATSLFPVFIFALVPFLTANGVAVLLLITGMIWYLFFNLISGLRSIPLDLEEAARSFGLTRWQYYRRLVLPAIFPAFVTGSITAFGGGWNTLVLAEYFRVNGVTLLSVRGVGQLISLGTYEPGGAPLLVVALFALVATVIAVNEIVWKPTYRRAVNKYRFD